MTFPGKYWLVSLRRKYAAWKGGVLGWAMGLAGLMVFFLWRAAPAWQRSTFMVEDGLWLSHLWREGFWDLVTAGRGDYLVLGNALVIWLADRVTAVCYGGVLAEAARVQAVVSCLYVTLQFGLMALLARRHLGIRKTLAVVVGMAVLPELGQDGVNFGVASNVGFFSAPVVAFLHLDWWQREGWTLRRRFGWLGLTAFHVLTSPAAAALCCGLGILRLADWGRVWWTQRSKVRLDVAGALWWALPVILCLPYLLRVQALTGEAYKTAYPELLTNGWIENLVARQWLYPVVAGWFTEMNNVVSVVVLAGVITGVAAVMWKEGRRGGMRGVPEWRVALVLGISGLALSGMTTFSRQWILRLNGLGYESVDPDRYYQAQGMLIGAALTLILLRGAGLFPQARSGLLVLMAGAWSFGLLRQAIHFQDLTGRLTPDDVSRRWPLALARTAEVTALCGGAEFTEVPVEITTPGVTMKVPVELLPTDLAEAENVRCRMVPWVEGPRSVEAPALQPLLAGALELRAIPRRAGYLLMWKADLSGRGSPGRAGRRIWLHGLPQGARGCGFFYTTAMPKLKQKESPPARKPAVNRSPDSTAMLWAYVFCPGVRSDAQVQTLAAGLTFAFGNHPDKPLAGGPLLAAGTRVAFSSLGGELACPPSGELKAGPALEVRWDPDQWAAHNASISSAGVSVEAVGSTVWDEAGYQALNPDVRRAGWPDGQTHYRLFGHAAGRPIRPHRTRLTFDKSKTLPPGYRFSHLAFRLQKIRGLAPRDLTLHLQGASGSSFAYRLVPPLQPGGNAVEYALPHLENGLLPADFELSSLELEWGSGRGAALFCPVWLRMQSIPVR